MAARKVVYVDFAKSKRPAGGGFGGGPRFVLGVFCGLLLLELLAAAVVSPAAIGATYFAPLVIALAVAGTLGARRLLVRLQVDYLHRRSRPGSDPGAGDDEPGRTLH